jgi:hypothetical protein
MSTIALHIIELVKSLPLEERRAVRDALSHDTFAPVEALEAAHSLHGRFAGGKMLDSLLRERASDRAREDEQTRSR